MALITGWRSAVVQPEGITPTRSIAAGVDLTEHATSVLSWRTRTEMTGLLEPSLRRCAVVAVTPFWTSRVQKRP
jgi:hypothetical protein